MPAKDGKLRVLALSGGGIRGLLTATVLQFIENHTGRRIHELFDMVAGTSTGGLMALALTKLHPLSASDCVYLYLRYGSTIFSRSAWRALYSANTILRPKYDGRGFARVAHDVFGPQALEDALCPTFVASYCLDTRLPVLHRSWRPDGLCRPLAKIALATSAAPTYFPPVEVGGHWHVDGGTVCNNPSLSAVIEACKLYGGHTRECEVLSIGTGLCRTVINSKSALGWGKIGWVAPLIDIMLDGVPDLTDAQMADLMLDGQYLHLEPAISAADAELDNTSTANLSRLQAIGEKVIDSQKGPLLALLDRL